MNRRARNTTTVPYTLLTYVVVLVVAFLVGGCATPPEGQPGDQAERSYPGPGPSVPSEEEPQGSAPGPAAPSEGPKEALPESTPEASPEAPAESQPETPPETPARPMPVLPSGELSTGDQPASVPEISSVPRWVPPDHTVAQPFSGQERRRIERWIQELPVGVVVVNEFQHSHDEMAGIYRNYLDSLVQKAGYSPRITPGHNTLVVTITLGVRTTESERHLYGASDLHLSMSLQGFSDAVASADVLGPTVLSSISYEDAQLNSLRHIDPNIVTNALTTLRDELSRHMGRQGIPYRVSQRPGSEMQEIQAILHSIGIPGAGRGVWLTPYPPEELEEQLNLVLQGSPYRVRLDAPTREVTLLREEER